MKASWRKGLSGAVSAIVIAVVLVAGLASASYINLTTARYNEAQMQEALRQARLGSELIRIHIHSTDGAIDSPPRITFVNVWGYESRIIQLVVIARNMTPIATIDLRGRPIVLPPGSRMTLEPSQIGLSYPTFKRMADELRSIHAYTEAGNSFGSTWGFPREDNLAGRTVSVTYSTTTTQVWSLPSFTTRNSTFTITSYTTIGSLPNVTTASIKAVHQFEKINVTIPNQNIGSIVYSWSIDASTNGNSAFPPAPNVNNLRPVNLIIGSSSDSFSWTRCSSSRGGGSCRENSQPGPVETFEAGTYQPIIDSPQRYIHQITVYRPGSSSVSHRITVIYSLSSSTIEPEPLRCPRVRDGGSGGVRYCLFPPGDYTVYRYYHVYTVYYQSYSGGGSTCSGCGSSSGSRPEQPQPSPSCNIVASAGNNGGEFSVNIEVRC
jgi:hypothetical protein